MTNVPLETLSIRVYPALKRRIQREAKAVRLRPSDYLRRRIEDLFGFDPAVSDTDENAHIIELED